MGRPNDTQKPKQEEPRNAPDVPDIKDPPSDLPDYTDPPEPTQPTDPRPPVIKSRAASMFDPNDLTNYIREPGDAMYYIREPIPSEVPYRL